jgi:hypothetical protein
VLSLEHSLFADAYQEMIEPLTQNQESFGEKTGAGWVVDLCGLIRPGERDKAPLAVGEHHQNVAGIRPPAILGEHRKALPAQGMRWMSDANDGRIRRRWWISWVLSQRCPILRPAGISVAQSG